MALLLIIIGIVLIDVAIRNTWSDLGTLIKGDFTGQGNFLYWVAAIAIIGAVGYARPLRAASNALLALVVVVFFLKNGTGFFSQIQSAISNPPAPAPTQPLTPISSPVPVQLTVNSGAGNALSSLGGFSGLTSAIGSAL